MSLTAFFVMFNDSDFFALSVFILLPQACSFTKIADIVFTSSPFFLSHRVAGTHFSYEIAQKSATDIKNDMSKREELKRCIIGNSCPYIVNEVNCSKRYHIF